jgi:hypothetical protein
MYYGNAAATEPVANSPYGSQNVWNTNYKLVWHLKETGTNPVADDATSNAKKSTENIWTPTASGKVGRGGAFSSSSHWLKTGSINYGNSNPLTYSCWVYLSGSSLCGLFLEDGRTGSDSCGFAFGVGNETTFKNNGNHLFVPLWGVDWQNTGVNIGTGWHLITVVLTAAKKTLSYIDGALIHTGTSTMLAAVNSQFYAARGSQTSMNFAGSLDEIRVSNTTRTLGWIKTEYNNQNSPSTFYSLSVTPAGSTYEIQRNDGAIAWETNTQSTLAATYPFVNRPPQIGD